jgi:hypothetical protein
MALLPFSALGRPLLLTHLGTSNNVQVTLNVSKIAKYYWEFSSEVLHSVLQRTQMSFWSPPLLALSLTFDLRPVFTPEAPRDESIINQRHVPRPTHRNTIELQSLTLELSRRDFQGIGRVPGRAIVGAKLGLLEPATVVAQ